MAYKGKLYRPFYWPRKGCFSGFRYMKGYGIYWLRYAKARVGKLLWSIKRSRKMANNAFDDCEKVEKALWFCDFFMFKRDWGYLQQLKEMQSSTYEEGVPFVNGMYTKLLPFLCKKVYKRVMGWTSERSLPVWYFFDYPRGGRCGNLWYSPTASMTSRLSSVTFKGEQSVHRRYG